MRAAIAFAAVAVIGPAVAGLVSNAVVAGGAASATAIEAAISAAAVIGNTVGGAVAGFAGGLIASGGDIQSAGFGALSGGLFGFVGASGAFGPVGQTTVGRVIAHGVIGGATDALRGGKFGPGFLVGAIGKLGTGFSARFGGFGGALSSAVIGGTASVIGGGKFQNGAVTAAFGYLLNSESSRPGSGLSELRRVAGRLIGAAGAVIDAVKVGCFFAQGGCSIGGPTVEQLLRPGGNLVGVPGSSPEIRELPGNADVARVFFDGLVTATGATSIGVPSYPGEARWALNQGFIGYRLESTSPNVAATIDVNLKGYEELRKIKFIE